MKNIERVIWIFITAVLIVFLFKACNNNPGSSAVVIQKITTYDTIKGEDIYIPQPYAIIDTVRDTIQGEVKYVPSSIDYIAPDKPVDPPPLAIRLYRDSIPLDSLGYAIVKDTVQGKILGRSSSYFLRVPTTTINRTTEAPKKFLKVYLGAEYQYPINYIGGSLAFQFKNDNILKGSYGYANGIPQYGAAYYVKIKLKK